MSYGRFQQGPGAAAQPPAAPHLASPTTNPPPHGLALPWGCLRAGAAPRPQAPLGAQTAPPGLVAGWFLGIWLHRLMARLCEHCACSMALLSHSTSTWHRATLSFAITPRMKLPKPRNHFTCACSGIPPSWQSLLGKKTSTDSLHRASHLVERAAGRPLLAQTKLGWAGLAQESLTPLATLPTGTTTTAVVQEMEEQRQEESCSGEVCSSIPACGVPLVERSPVWWGAPHQSIHCFLGTFSVENLCSRHKQTGTKKKFKISVKIISGLRWQSDEERHYTHAAHPPQLL